MIISAGSIDDFLRIAGSISDLRETESSMMGSSRVLGEISRVWGYYYYIGIGKHVGRGFG